MSIHTLSRCGIGELQASQPAPGLVLTVAVFTSVANLDTLNQVRLVHSFRCMPSLGKAQQEGCGMPCGMSKHVLWWLPPLAQVRVGACESAQGPELAKQHSVRAYLLVQNAQVAL